MKLNCTITQVQCSQKVINIITIIIKTKHHLLTNGVGQGDWWERDEDCETLLFVSFNACFVYGPTPVLLFVMKISFCDNESVLNRIKIASDPHNVNLPLESSLGPYTMNREISSNHKRWHQFSFHQQINTDLGPWEMNSWESEKLCGGCWMAGNGACWVVHHQTALSDENKQSWRHNRCDPWWCFVRPHSNDPAHRVTLRMNETIAQYHHYERKRYCENKD